MFYSDQQRKWFFANIAPMEKWGLGPLLHLAKDPIGEAKKWGMYAVSEVVLETFGAAMGLKKEEDKEIIQKLQETIKGEDYRAILTKDEMGKISKASSETLQKEWAAKLAKHINKDDKVKKFILDNADTLLGEELNIAAITPGGEFGIPRAKGKKHYGIDIRTFGKDDVEYPIPYDGIVTFAGRAKDYGNYLKVLCRDEDGKFFTLKGGHLAKYTVKTGDTLSEGDSVGIIGNTGEDSHGIHLDIKKNYISLNNNDIENKEYEHKLELSGELQKKLEGTNVCKRKKLSYEDGKLKLKGYLGNWEDLSELRKSSKELDEALDKLSKKPIKEYETEKKKLTTSDVWDIIQGKNKSWAVKDNPYVSPKTEAEKIIGLIKKNEIPKRSDEVVKKISAKATKEFAAWILASKTEKKAESDKAEKPAKVKVKPKKTAEAGKANGSAKAKKTSGTAGKNSK